MIDDSIDPVEYQHELEREYEQQARQICPHCQEPLGEESAGSDTDKPDWHHLICLKPEDERMARVRHLLHRLDRHELTSILAQAAALLDRKYNNRSRSG